MTNGKKNREKGLKGEQFYVEYFKNIGYKKCDTSKKRSIQDNAGIDLINIPFNVQIKSGISSFLFSFSFAFYPLNTKRKNQPKLCFAEPCGPAAF